MNHVRGLAAKTRKYHLASIRRLLFGQFADQPVVIDTPGLCSSRFAVHAVASSAAHHGLQASGGRQFSQRGGRCLAAGQ
jgi:hypothetical protein